MSKWLAILILLNALKSSAFCGSDAIRRLVDSASFKTSVEKLKAGRPFEQSDLVRAIVANSADLPAIEKAVLAKKMRPAEIENVQREFRRAKEKVQDIRRAYPELANVTGEDEARLISRIAKLEESKVPREKIREALARGSKACRVR